MAIYITLRVTDEVRSKVPVFKSAIASFDVKVTEEWEDEDTGTMVMVTNADLLGVIRYVNRAVYAFFDDAILSLCIDVPQYH
jgi:hypothetical protein